MARNPNAGGKGPKVTKSSKNQGPIFGKATSPTGSTRPWSPKQGTNGSAKPKHAVQSRAK